jgi:2',3'-cyclic-nucleotide 2'-phosphodiesterase / 3'-nucleotidase
VSSILDLHPITRRSLLGGIAATSALVLLHPFTARAAANQAHLRLMETTDIHVNVFPYDYYADKPNDTMGLARTATIIDNIRAEAANSLLIDNGDLLQGNPMGDYMAYQHGMNDGDVHPVIKAMNTLGYTVGTLGNHEFNYGLDFMFKVLGGANFPLVCANLTKGQLASDPKKDDLFFKPYVIVESRSRTAQATRARSRSASSASCRRRSCSGTSRTSKARRRPATSSRLPRPGFRR